MEKEGQDQDGRGEKEIKDQGENRNGEKETG